MKVGIIGSGGREHALLRAVAKNPIIKEIYAIPGNGGMADEAVCLNIDIKNIDEVLAVCLDRDLDYVIVAPDRGKQSVFKRFDEEIQYTYCFL